MVHSSSARREGAWGCVLGSVPVPDLALGCGEAVNVGRGRFLTILLSLFLSTSPAVFPLTPRQDASGEWGCLALLSSSVHQGARGPSQYCYAQDSPAARQTPEGPGPSFIFLSHCLEDHFPKSSPGED